MTDLPAQMHSPASTAVATRPAPVDNGTLDSSDVRLPRMRVGQLTSKAVRRGIVDFGAVYVNYDEDDDDPTILAPKPDGSNLGDPVIFYVLGFQKGYSYTDASGDFATTKDNVYPDLSLVQNQDPRKVQRTYDYTLVVPGFEDLPVKFVMSGKWGGQAAKSLNTRLGLLDSKGIERSTQPFQMRMRFQENDKGAWYGASVSVADVPKREVEKHQKLVNEFKGFFGAPAADDDRPQAAAAPIDQPSID